MDGEQRHVPVAGARSGVLLPRAIPRRRRLERLRLRRPAAAERAGWTLLGSGRCRFGTRRAPETLSARASLISHYRARPPARAAFALGRGGAYRARAICSRSV